MMNRYVEDFINGDYVGCFGLNNCEIIYEEDIRELVNRSSNVYINYDEEELVIDIDNKINVVSYV